MNQIFPDSGIPFDSLNLGTALGDGASPTYNSYDYFTLSTFRDLMFHAHEHLFSVREIAAALDALGLEFRGFRLPRPIVAAFGSRFSHPSALRDLAAWDAFEQTAPAAFANMYSFWCRRRD